jgi:WD40 repeat protein
LFLVGGKYLLSGSRDAHLAVWDTESGQLLDRFPAHLGTLNHLVAIPEWGCIGSAGRDKEIRLWDSKTLELRRVINREHAPQHAHTHSVNRLLWIPEKSMLLSAGDDRKIRAWQISGRT